MRRAAALILGGGPAGAAAAILLGRHALVLERTRDAEDALCGGFLSWRTLDALAALGVDPDALNPRRVTRVRLFAGMRSSEAALPRPALGVSRRRLDALLRERAQAAGAAIEHGVTIRALENGGARLADGAHVGGDALLLATGKHELRGVPREAPGRDPALGLRVHLAAAPALQRLIGDAIELHLFDRGYAGLVLQEDGSTNLCMAVRRSRLQAAGTPHALLDDLGREVPRLGERLAYLEGDATIDAVANVPYGWRTEGTAPGLYRLGDQAGVIPSLAGEGMGIAVASGASAARAVLSGEPATDWQPRFAARLARPLGVAGLVRAAAEHPSMAALLLAAARAPLAVRAVARLTRIRHEAVDA